MTAVADRERPERPLLPNAVQSYLEPTARRNLLNPVVKCFPLTVETPFRQNLAAVVQLIPAVT